MGDSEKRGFIPTSEAGANTIEVLNLPEVRVSSASFTIIQDEAGRYALLINKNRAKKGEFLLTPIGGAIEATEDGLSELQSALEIDPAAFEKGKDLRFKMPGNKANLYREWFLSGHGREADPSREVIEELVDESGLLSAAELQDLRCTKVGYNTELEETTRTGQEGQATLRLLEIFQAQLSAETLQKLQELASQPDSLIRFVTREEIILGQTTAGTKIGAVSKNLLELKETIEPFN